MLNLAITSPEECLVKGQASKVTVPGTEGEFEIRADHCAMMALLGTGTIIAHIVDQPPFVLYIDAGVIAISENNVSIITDSAHTAREAEKEALETTQRQKRRDLQSQDTINHHALLKELTQLSAELSTIEKTRQYRKKR